MKPVNIDAVHTLPQLWENVSKQSVPEQVVLRVLSRYGTEPINYKELNAKSHCLAAYLLLRGCQPGERVLILADNGIYYPCYDLATQFVGGINITLGRKFRPAQIAAVLAQTQPRFVLVAEYERYDALRALLAEHAPQAEVITHTRKHDHPEEGDRSTTLLSAIELGKVYWRENAAEIKRRKEAVLPTDAATILYTQQQGQLRGVVLSHHNLLAAVKTGMGFFTDLSRSDEVLSYLPPAYALQRVAGYYLPLALGLPMLQVNDLQTLARAVALESASIFIAHSSYLRFQFGQLRRQWRQQHVVGRGALEKALQLAQQHYAQVDAGYTPNWWLRTRFAGTQRGVLATVRKKYFATMRYVVAEGAGLGTLLEYFFRAMGLPLITGYGVPETAGLMTLSPPAALRTGAVGIVIPGLRLKVKTQQAEYIFQHPPQGNAPAGRLYVQGHTVMQGLWPANEPMPEWLDTGLTGSITAGYLYLNQAASRA